MSEREELTGVVREIVEELRMSGSRLADKLGVHRSTVSRWASGTRQPSAEFVLDLIQALHDYNQELSQKMSSWEYKLHDLHLRLLQAEWPEDRPFTKDHVLDYIAEREEEREAKRKDAKKRNKKEL